jgi:FkbM family methyltransferase
MKKYFLDCGTNLGQGLLQFIDKEIIDDSFEIHLFEPNPYAMKYTKKRLSDERFKKYKFFFHEVALWTEKCKKSLTIEAFNGEYICQHTGQYLGHDLKSGGATNIMGDEWIKPHYIENEHLTEKIIVECIDFSFFLKQKIEKNSYVICKMDIEGAEYNILRKLINDNVMNIINEIYIEWHDHLLKSDNDTNALKNEIKAKNIKIENWI